MELSPILFWLFAAMAVAGGLMAVLLPRIVHAVFSLMLCFVGISAIYALAAADFLAIMQIVVYVGGILVLLAFGILLTGRTAQALGDTEVRHRPLGLVVGLVLFLSLLGAIGASQFHFGESAPADGTTGALGTLLVTDYVLAFEFAAILLLIALIGAAYLVRRGDA